MDFTKKAIDLTAEDKLALLGILFYNQAKIALEAGREDVIADIRLRWGSLHPDIPGHESRVRGEFHTLFTWQAKLRLNIEECTVEEMVRAAFPNSYKEILYEACNGHNQENK
jgi:hypothetical protein